MSSTLQSSLLALSTIFQCLPKNGHTISDSKSSDTSSNSTFDNDYPDVELQIPGEPILCKSRVNGDYWPASIKAYVGIREAKPAHPIAFKKYYLVVFCDNTSREVPRSFFLTSIERNFSTVKVSLFCQHFQLPTSSLTNCTFLIFQDG